MALMKLWVCFTAFCSVVFCASLLWTYKIQSRVFENKRQQQIRYVEYIPSTTSITEMEPVANQASTDGFTVTRTLTSKISGESTNSAIHNTDMDPRGDAVLIVTYVRSGSSLVGELFNQNPDAFYMFEPTHELDRASMKRHLTYTDNSQRTMESTGLPKKEFMTDVVKNLISCDFTKVPVNVLAPESPSHWFFIALGRHIHLRTYASCILKYNTTAEDIQCIPLIKRACDKSFKAFKIVVLRMTDLEPILRQFERVKILYLVRDPRASILSMRKYKLIRPVTLQKCNMTCEIVKRCKEHMIPDLVARDRLQSRFPGRIMTLRYEDLADNPIAYADKIYEFIGREMPANVREWLVNTTSGKIEGDVMSDPYGTSRVNSSQTAHQWERTIQPSLGVEVDSYCGEVIQKLGYESFANIQSRKSQERLRKDGQSNRVQSNAK
ncbi:carbohydrate sulfotransferase 1 [Lingula anatina]|uniref:Carbohydrate sulfotransferase 1 n=1 Tax=Lingula anatina TaxID=7574 RepID=A0A1S3HAZ3_LINAN|nr:carbohydrate sulfotransferase 1 [Lingula anatina]|eukprot:XP_013382626.1 carbohydrate sulfotransferase 1 [Lingula anatina]